MAEFTLVGLVYDADTREVVRIIYPTEGDHELDDPEKTMFALDPTRNWVLKKITRESAAARFASSGITGGNLSRVS